MVCGAKLQLVLVFLCEKGCIYRFSLKIFVFQIPVFFFGPDISILWLPNEQYGR